MEVYVDGDKMDVCVSCLPYDMHIPGTSVHDMYRESLQTLGQRHTLL